MRELRKKLQGFSSPESLADRIPAAGHKKKARPFAGIGLFQIGVAVTYFRMRMQTIIGANPFHGPVRDGKAWFQAAVAAR